MLLARTHERNGGLRMSAVTIRRIAGVQLFDGCPRSQLKAIDRLGMTLDLSADRTLCCEGKPGSQFFVLIEGLVEVHSADGQLALLRAGAWFGETALVYKTVQRATVTTVVASTVIVFNRREFDALRDLAPRVRERLDVTAALFAHGDAPTSQPWYQPIGTARDHSTIAPHDQAVAP
jgi:CRP-like cAMP-binding protein